MAGPENGGQDGVGLGLGLQQQAAVEREMHVVAAIEEWNRGLPPQAQAAKYTKLGRSPLSFYRGTNHLFWADFR